MFGCVLRTAQAGSGHQSDAKFWHVESGIRWAGVCLVCYQLTGITFAAGKTGARLKEDDSLDEVSAL